MEQNDKLSKLEILLLELVRQLQDSGNAYGTKLHMELEQRFLFSVSLGACYVALDRLEAMELVTSSFSDPTPARGMRHKRFFKLINKKAPERITYY